MDARSRDLLRAWLWTLYGLVLGMVVLGGITRLTGSGLSMVEWRPLFGALPPLDADEWNRVFARYQESPQYRLVNAWMTLDDFKRIFVWEYLHRLLGRLIGVAFIVPGAWLWLKGHLEGAPKLRLLSVLVLGALQGALGWFMVMSGLVDVPEVSHFRLAAHLALAFFVAHLILWIILDLGPPNTPVKVPRHARLIGWSLVALVGIQIVWGAFMAGRRAGYLYRSFPDFDGELVPSSLLSEPSWLHASVAHPVGIHVAHRFLGYLVLLAIFATFVWLGRAAPAAHFRGVRARLLAVGVLQFGLGALTVMYGVPIALAVLHQAGGFLLLSVCVELAHVMGRANARPQPAGY